ncbi:hypothetical protein VTI28DRAFT_587 [Corynascus sepedonium]
MTQTMADQTIETAFEAAIASGKINGAVICAADASGAFVYERALGHRTLLSGEKVAQRLDDILYLASATKLIATVAALQCVEEGLVTLTGDDVMARLPELARQPVLREDGNGNAREKEPRAAPITLEALLSHTSGAGYDFLVPHLAAWRAANDTSPSNAQRPVEEAFAYPLVFQPNTGWMYGPGIDWAGRLVERVTGATLGDRVRGRICAPLGVSPQDAHFYPVEGDEARARVVDLNPDDPEGLGRAVLAGEGHMNRRSKGHFGGHGLFMTGPAYLAVLRSLLVNDGKLLRPETVDDIFRDRIGPDSEARFQAAVAGPTGAFFRVGIPPDVSIGHGLGGMLTREDVDGWYAKGTLSWGGGMTFAWFIDRQTGLCGLGAIQSALPMDHSVVGDLKQTFRHDIYRKHAAWKRERQG